MNPTSVGRLRRLAARHETTLVVACVAGVVLLTVASGGGFLSGNSVRIFFQFLTVPVLIGLAQMVALCVGQLNLAVGALGGCAAALIASLLTDSGWPTLPALALAQLPSAAE